MTFKELRTKVEYVDYSIMAFGRPLDMATIPFTLLPKDKKLDDCEVVEIKIINEDFIQTGVNFRTLKPIKSKLMKGHIYVHVK